MDIVGRLQKSERDKSQIFDERIEYVKQLLQDYDWGIGMMALDPD